MRAMHVAIGERLKTSAAGSNNRKLCHREDAIEQNERENDDRFDIKHRDNIEIRTFSRESRQRCMASPEWAGSENRIVGQRQDLANVVYWSMLAARGYAPEECQCCKWLQ